LDTLLIFTHSFISSSFLHLLHKNYSAMPTNVVSVYLRFLHLGPTKTKSPIFSHSPISLLWLNSHRPPPALLELRLPAQPVFSPVPPLPTLLELRPPALRSAQHLRRLPCLSSGHPPARRSALDRRCRCCSSSARPRDIQPNTVVVCPA
jgi:hypothetical protein